MKKIWVLTGILALAHMSYGADFTVTGLTGYQGGLGFGVTATASHFAQGFPLGFELGVAHIRLDPGNPEKARRIFINEATNGTPEKEGYIWDFRFNLLFPTHFLNMQDAAFYVGVRRALFTGHFAYVGGNEIFDVTSNPWGFGAGLKANFPMGKSVGFTMNMGLDYYPNELLTGHDTSYYPDGETVNEKEEYTYKDADTAINQPKFQPIFMVGITVGL
jgi:hypothetical protein